MTVIHLKYVASDVDRHGNVRHYVRKPGQPKVRLKGKPGSEEFMAGYHAALSGALPVKAVRAKARKEPGSFTAICIRYYACSEFQRLDTSTQSWQRRALDGIAKKHGDKPIRDLEARHIRRLRDEKADTPAAANHMLKALRALFRWAIEEEIVARNPAVDVKLVQYAKKGHHTWTLEEVAQYEQHHPVGSKARLAMAILLYTAGRREDAVRLGRQHLQNGRLRYVQAKNEHRSPVYMDVPAHPDLLAIVEATPSGHLPFLTTEYGKPFTANGFGNKFREWCDEAGLAHCSAHGLRKAAAARLAEAGCTPHEIMSITGHKSLQEVERYTREVNRPSLADRAMTKLRKG